MADSGGGGGERSETQPSVLTDPQSNSDTIIVWQLLCSKEMATQEKSNRPWELVILQAKFCHCLQILIACKTHSYPVRAIRLFALYSLKEQTIQINHKIIENIRDQNKQKVYLWVFIILFKGQLCKHTQWDPTQTYLRVFGLVWFSTTTIKQISQKSESHDFFGFPVHIKVRLALYCLWSVQ